jgi:ABC-type multidrug transport system fused ATPase/permease subunit
LSVLLVIVLSVLLAIVLSVLLAIVLSVFLAIVLSVLLAIALSVLLASDYSQISSTNKNGRQCITEILMKVASNIHEKKSFKITRAGTI